MATATRKKAALPNPAQPAAKSAAKSAAKPAPKTAAKPAASKSAAKAPPAPAAAPAAPAAPAAKSAKPVKADKPGKADKSEKADKAPKAKKAKQVRDSFTIPKDEYAEIASLKLRAARLGKPVKKSELLRAGIKALVAMGDAAFLAATQAVPAIKTGRPSQSAD